MLVLKAIHDYAEQHQRSVSYRELSEITGLKSTGTIARHVEILQDRGYLRKHNHGEPRSLIVTLEGIKAVQSRIL